MALAFTLKVKSFEITLLQGWGRIDRTFDDIIALFLLLIRLCHLTGGYFSNLIDRFVKNFILIKRDWLENQKFEMRSNVMPELESYVFGHQNARNELFYLSSTKAKYLRVSALCELWNDDSVLYRTANHVYNMRFPQHVGLRNNQWQLWINKKVRVLSSLIFLNNF